MNWQKYPSATTGGKQFFYRAKTANGWFSIVWNRATLTYHATFPGCLDSVQFSTVPSAKRFLEHNEFSR